MDHVQEKTARKRLVVPHEPYGVQPGREYYFDDRWLGRSAGPVRVSRIRYYFDKLQGRSRTSGHVEFLAWHPDFDVTTGRRWSGVIIQDGAEFWLSEDDAAKLCAEAVDVEIQVRASRNKGCAAINRLLRGELP